MWLSTVASTTAPPVSEEDDRFFSLLWAIGRTNSKKQANLSMEWVDVNLAVSVTLPNKRSYKAEEDKSLAQVPILTNHEKIPAQTLLIALDDEALHKVMEQQQRSKEGGSSGSAAKKVKGADNA